MYLRSNNSEAEEAFLRIKKKLCVKWTKIAWSNICKCIGNLKSNNRNQWRN